MLVASLFFFYLLQLETSISSILTYVAGSMEGLWLPILVFGSVTVGSGLGLWPKLSKTLWGDREKGPWHNSSVFHILALPLVIFFASLRFFPQLHIIFSIFPFVAIGVVLATLYARVDLWALVVGFFIAGAVFYGAHFFAGDWVAKYQVPLLFVTLFCIGLAEINSAVDALFRIVVLGSVIALYLSGYFYFPSILQRTHPTFQQVRQVAKSRVTSLFRTQLLYLNQKNLLILEANGVRFAVLMPRPVEKAIVSHKKSTVATYSAPYVIDHPRKVLVIGPAEGGNVIAALAHSVKDIWAVDINPAMYDFLLHEARPYTGGFYARPEVHRVVSEGRHFLETTHKKFDLITLQGVQTGSQVSYESPAEIESYLFTNEALKALWKRLTSRGLIFFDEYQNFFPGHHVLPGKSMLNRLASAAKQILPLDSNKQIRLVSYDQVQNNPNSWANHHRRREALFISKVPISNALIEQVRQTIGPNGKIEKIQRVDPAAYITDDRPMFILASLQRYTKWLAMAALAALFCVGFLLRKQEQRRESFQLLVVGAVYLLFIIAMTGPAALVLGNPAYVVPIVYGGLLGGSLLGAWIVLKLRLEHISFEVGLFVFLLLFALTYQLAEKKLLGTHYEALRFGSVLGVSFLFGALIEIPYMKLLKEVEGWNRAVRFFVENAGGLLAVPVGLWLQVNWGLHLSIDLCVCLSLALTLSRVEVWALRGATA